MRIIEKMKEKIRSWLNVRPADPLNFDIVETLDYEGNAIKNRIWYRGDSNELQQLYSQLNTGVDKYKFWACSSTAGLEIRKLHTGLPGTIVNMLSTVSLSDMNEFKFKNDGDKDIWENIDKESKFTKRLGRVVNETLYIGDGAYKISFDKDFSDYPVIEFYPGDEIEIKSDRGRLKEIVFHTNYIHQGRTYTLKEYYGYGYVKSKLFYKEEEVPMGTIPQTEGLGDVYFSGADEEGATGQYMLATQVCFYESTRWKDRGQSIFDAKTDCFDSLDETWSQWMDALRAGRTKEYIPENLIPRDPEKGDLLRPNPFDNRFIKVDSAMGESNKDMIQVTQPLIQHESYTASYITALDQCMQGLISPSTLGIDVKKLDNADAQREKEKATLYTRNAIVGALEEDLPRVISAAVMFYKELTSSENTSLEPVKVTVDFGEYANPSFESQIETIGKGRTNGIISVEAAVDELYGDSKDEDWKAKEVARLKEEQGIATIEEPAVKMATGAFSVNTGE